MESTELLTSLLKLGQEWKVVDIRINSHLKEIDLFIEYIESTGICPNTQELCPIYDFRDFRRFRHLDIFEYKTFLNARLPRVINGNSEINTIDIAWAGSRVSYTYLFESKVIECLVMSKNQTQTADYFDVTFDIVHGIMQRAVSRGLQRRNLDDIKAVGIDEKSIKNGQNYITILSDPIGKKVIDIIEGRKVEDAEELLTWSLSSSQLDGICLVTMDMWKPFMLAVTEVIPQAGIVHDKFHISKYLNNAVDEVRKEEVKTQESLKKTKYIFLKNKENWTDLQCDKFNEIDKINSITSKAWHIKENFKGIYEQWTPNQCLNFFKDWYTNTLESGLKKMIKVADTLLSHLTGIINAAIHEITNSNAENMNSQIQVVKSVGRGFANVEGYRNSILFFQGKLNMFPL
jgi:transposase